MIRLARPALLVVMLLGADDARVSAQNLFEVQVFPDEILERGETEVELHQVVMPQGHVHLSFELAHGWSRRFETGLFLETSPAKGDTHAAFTGWHVRPKLRLPEWKAVPAHLSVSAEYSFVKEPGDASFRQALTLTPILEWHTRTFEMSANPGIEIALTGARAGTAPVFEPSAKFASRLTRSTWAGLEYYAETGSIRHFEPLSEQRHLLFAVVDVRTPAGWDLDVGVGRGLTGGTEHWVVKSIVGLRLPR